MINDDDDMSEELERYCCIVGFSLHFTAKAFHENKLVEMALASASSI